MPDLGTFEGRDALDLIIKAVDEASARSWRAISP
jgi:hypothetical protein